MFEILPHTADVRLRVRAPDLRTLFEDALRGLFAILGPVGTGQPIERTVEIESADPTTLVVDFLSEALALAHTRLESYAGIARFDLDSEDHRLTATLAGTRVTGFAGDVKAVTYHEAELVQDESGWETMLVFDI